MYVSEICLPQVNLFCFENVLFLSVPTSDLGKSPLNHLFFYLKVDVINDNINILLF